MPMPWRTPCRPFIAERVALELKIFSVLPSVNTAFIGLDSQLRLKSADSILLVCIQEFIVSAFFIHRPVFNHGPDANGFMAIQKVALQCKHLVRHTVSSSLSIQKLSS